MDKKPTPYIFPFFKIRFTQMQGTIVDEGFDITFTFSHLADAFIQSDITFKLGNERFCQQA